MNARDLNPAGRELEILRDGEASIVHDERARPIVFATWFGETTEALVHAYYQRHVALLRRVAASGERIVLITDTFAAARPSPKARKAIGDLLAEHRLLTDRCTMRSYLVIDGAIMRGVFTALSWVSPRMAESIVVASPEEAIRGALADLDAAGMRRPSNLGSYTRPRAPS